VNPRFSGGLPLSLHAGADLVGEYLRAIMGRDPRADRLVARPGVTMVRYFDEVYEFNHTAISEGE
jgi:carbamoyl-phosphate synthase large subunit